MKTLLWIAIGILVGILSWVPLNLSGPHDIPFIPAILAFVGSFVGGVIVLVAVVQWVRHGSAPRRSGDPA